MPVDWAWWVAQFAGPVGTLAGVYLIYLGTRKSASARIEAAAATAKAAVESATAAREASLEQIKDKALIDVYNLTNEARKEIAIELRQEKEVRAKQGERLGSIELDMAHLRGAHDLLLRLQCPLANSGECPVFRSDRAHN